MSYAPTSETLEDAFQRHAQAAGSHIRKIQQNVTSLQRLANQINFANDNHELKQQL